MCNKLCYLRNHSKFNDAMHHDPNKTLDCHQSDCCHPQKHSILWQGMFRALAVMFQMALVLEARRVLCSIQIMIRHHRRDLWTGPTHTRYLVIYHSSCQDSKSQEGLVWQVLLHIGVDCSLGSVMYPLSHSGDVTYCYSHCIFHI